MTKRGVILLAHGSRLQEANEEVFQLAALLETNEGAGFYCGVAFLQGGSPTLQEAVTSAVTEGCTFIFTVPFFLTSGVHIRDDIPEMLEQVRQDNPELTLVLCRPLGCDPRLAPILWERVTEKMTELSECGDNPL